MSAAIQPVVMRGRLADAETLDFDGTGETFLKKLKEMTGGHGPDYVNALPFGDVLLPFSILLLAVLFTTIKSLIGWYLGSSAVASSYGAPAD